eukprot:8824962-Alexandrium_andersonii.AAC.1
MTDPHAPWQNGRVERHGGWVKERLGSELVSGRPLPQSVAEVDALIMELVACENMWFHRGGFLPASWSSGPTRGCPTRS